MLFKDAVDLALAEMREELSPTSLPTWQCHARKALAYWGPERDLTTVTRLEVQGWINARAKEVKASTIGHERAFLSRLWRVLEDRGLDTGLQCPLLRLRMPKKRTDKRQITGEVASAQELGHTYLFGDQVEDRFLAACNWSKRVWYPTVRTIGKGGHFHGLRHRGAHLAWANGAPIEATSKMLGHSNIPQTEHYIGVTEDTMWAAAHATGKGASGSQPNPPQPVRVEPEPEPDPDPAPRRARETDWIFSM